MFKTGKEKRYCLSCKQLVEDYYKHTKICRSIDNLIDFSVAKRCSDAEADKYLEVANALSTKHIMPSMDSWSDIKRKNAVKFNN